MRGVFYILGFLILPLVLRAEDFEHFDTQGGSNSQTLQSESTKMKQELTLRRMKASVEGIGKFANERNLKFGLEEAERSLEYLIEHPDTFAKNGKQFSDDQLKEFIQVVFKKSDTNQADFSALREVVDEQRAKYLPKSDENISKTDTLNNSKDGRESSVPETDSKKATQSKAYNDPDRAPVGKLSNLNAPPLAIPYPYEMEARSQFQDLSAKNNSNPTIINSAKGSAIKPNENKASIPVPSMDPGGPVMVQNAKPSSASFRSQKSASTFGKKESDIRLEKQKQNEPEEKKIDLGEDQNNQITQKEPVVPNSESSQVPVLTEAKNSIDKSDESGTKPPTIENSYYDYFSDLSKKSVNAKPTEFITDSPEKSSNENGEKLRASEQSTEYGTSSGGGFASYRSTGPGTGTKVGEPAAPPGTWLPARPLVKTPTSLVPNFVRTKAGELIRRFKARFGNIEKINTETAKLGIRLPRTLSASLLTVGSGAENTIRNLDSILSFQEIAAENEERTDKNLYLMMAGMALVCMIVGIRIRRATRRAK